MRRMDVYILAVQTTCSGFVGMARPERFELPTAWFLVSSLIVNIMFLL